MEPAVGVRLDPRARAHLGREGLYGGTWMTDLLSRAERNRNEAAKFSDLAKSASSPFLRDYYLRIAERYLSLEGEWRPPGRQGNSNPKQDRSGSHASGP